MLSALWFVVSWDYTQAYLCMLGMEGGGDEEDVGHLNIFAEFLFKLPTLRRDKFGQIQETLNNSTTGMGQIPGTRIGSLSALMVGYATAHMVLIKSHVKALPSVMTLLPHPLPPSSTRQMTKMWPN